MHDRRHTIAVRFSVVLLPEVINYAPVKALFLILVSQRDNNSNKKKCIESSQKKYSVIVRFKIKTENHISINRTLLSYFALGRTGTGIKNLKRLTLLTFLFAPILCSQNIKSKETQQNRALKYHYKYGRIIE